MPVNGGTIGSLKKQNKRGNEQIVKHMASNEDLKKIKDVLFDNRLKPVSLSIIDFYTDFHKKLKLLIESGLYFEYDEALIHYMVSYHHFGEIYEFSKVEIVEICEISEINPDVVYSRYNHLKSYMKKK